MARIVIPLVAAALAGIVPSAPATAQNAVSLTKVAPRSISGVRFRFVADGPIRGGFAIAGDRLIFGTETGSLYAIHPSSGRLVWRRSAGSPVLSTPALAGSRAYFTTWDNALHAVDVATGREAWRRDLGRTLGPNDYWEYYVSSPVIAGGSLYVGSGSGRVAAIDAATGRTIWSTDLGARVRTTPQVTADKVIVGTMMGHVVALNRSDGRQLWNFATVGAAQNFAFKQNDTRSVVTQPIVVGDTVIAGGRDGNIYGIHLKTGAGRWRETHDGGSWILGLASDGTHFYSGSGSAFIMQAADPATGKELWRSPTANAMFGGLALAGGVLVSNGSNGNLFGYDAATGAQLWRVRLGDMTLSSPLVADGVVFTGSDDGTVVALETRVAPQPKLDRYVYSFSDEPPTSAFWFKPEMLAGIRGGFLTSGYARLGSQELAKALARPIGDKGRSIVVLADTRMPDDVGATQLRSFLNGGGVLVLIGPDPLIYSFDAQGAPVAIDEDKAKAAFGLSPADKERDYGYNVSTFTPAAKPLGLTGTLVAIGATRPAEVSTVLASDRTGMATAWTKRFDNRGLLIDLPLPRNRSIDLSGYVDAIDLAVARNSPAQP